MSLDPGVLLWSLVAPLVLGMLALRALGIRWVDDRLAWPGWAWCVGGLVLGLAQLGFLAVGLTAASWWVLPPLLALPLSVLAWRRRGAPVAGGDEPRGGWGYAVWVGLLVGLVLLRIVAAGTVPVVEADEGNIWSLEAKTLFLADGLDAAFVQSQELVLHPDYPLLNPLLQAWVYSQAGEIVHFENRVPIQLFALSLLLIAAGALRRLLHPVAAGFLLLLLVTDATYATLCRRGYADAMVATGWLLAFDAWLRWRGSGELRWWGLGACGAALALWSKNEAMMHACAILVAVFVSRVAERGSEEATAGEGRRARMAWLLLPAGVVAVQLLVNLHLGLRSDLLGDNPTGRSLFVLAFQQLGERFGPLMNHAFSELFVRPACDPFTHLAAVFRGGDGEVDHMRVAQGIFAVFLVALVWLPRTLWRDELRIPSLALLLALLGTHFVYLGSWLELGWHLETSYSRVVFQLLPAAFLWFALLVAASAQRTQEPLRPRSTVH